LDTTLEWYAHTALYMSPEQIREPGSVDRRSDIYGFGCVLYEMLTGPPPFNPSGNGDGDTDFAIKLAHVQQAPPPLRMMKPDLSPQLEAVVMRCLAKNPEERYGTCRELRHALTTSLTAATAAVVETPQAAGNRVEKARLIGILGLAITVLGRIVAGSHWPGSGSTFFGATVVCGLVLGIVAIVKGKAASRLLDKGAAHPAERNTVKLAVALGWTAVAAFVLIAALG
jgi:serine/threonine-protein kinase